MCPLQVDAELAQPVIVRRQRIVSGENGSMNGIPFAGQRHQDDW